MNSVNVNVNQVVQKTVVQVYKDGMKAPALANVQLISKDQKIVLKVKHGTLKVAHVNVSQKCPTEVAQSYKYGMHTNVNANVPRSTTVRENMYGRTINVHVNVQWCKHVTMERSGVQIHADVFAQR